VTKDLHASVMRDIVEPTIRGMASEGHPFRGFLYVGLMLTEFGPKVIEFNARLGDPEAQVVLPLILDPLAPILIDAARGRLVQSECQTSPDKLVGVVLASRGYPESAEPGVPIDGVADAERLPRVTVYHAATARDGPRLVTAGGRVLTVVGRGPGFPEAIERAYAGVQRIAFDGMQYRRDIGTKALATVGRPVE
jgi:phosphoribosylamine--glycine ligase